MFVSIRDPLSRASRSSSAAHAEHTPELHAEVSRLQVNRTAAAPPPVWPLAGFELCLCGSRGTRPSFARTWTD